MTGGGLGPDLRDDRRFERRLFLREILILALVTGVIVLRDLVT